MRNGACATVMLVNDDTSFVDVAGDALRVEGLAVLLVPGASQAITAISTGFWPDAVMVDVEDDADVDRVLRAVRGTPALRDIPVCIVSRDDEKLVEMLDDGLRRSHELPADAHELAFLLDTLCSARHGQGESFQLGVPHSADDGDLPLVGHA